MNSRFNATQANKCIAFSSAWRSLALGLTRTLIAVVCVSMMPSCKPARQPQHEAAKFSAGKSGVRHNAECRYFDAAKPCGATDGHPCKVCGG